MIIQGQELFAVTPSAPLKFVANENGIVIFPVGQQHSTMKAPGISYEDDSHGNALAGLIQENRVEIRGHRQFSVERVKEIWSSLCREPKLHPLENFQVSYQGEDVALGAFQVNPDEIFARLKKRAHAEVGIYYVVRYPRNWKLYPLQQGAFGDSEHIEGWRRFVAPELADAWASAWNLSTDQLQLLPFHLAFPRGRIKRAAIGEFTVFHGDDLLPTGIAHAAIEKAFGLGSEQINWTIDPHEKCRTDHKNAVRQMLSITEDWPSVLPRASEKDKPPTAH